MRTRTAAATDTATDLHWGWGGLVWNNDGDTVSLYDSAWALVDRTSY